MSNKNDELYEIYDEYVNKVNPREKMEDVSRKQGLTVSKIKEKIIAGVAVILVGATALTVALVKKNSNNSKADPVTTSDVATDLDDQNEEYEYVLVEDFNVNNESELDAVVSDVKAIVGDDYDVENIIKYFNSTLTKDDFSSDMSDTEIFEQLQEYGPALYDILSNLVNDYVNAIENLEADKASGLASDIAKLVSASSIISNDNSARDYAIDLADILESLLKGVNNGDISNRDELANEFYNLSEEINSDEELDIYTKAIMHTSIYATIPLFGDSLTEEKTTELKENNDPSLDYNEIGFNYVSKMGLNYSEVVSEMDDGNMGRDLTPTTEVYNGSDASDANNHAGSTGEENVSEVVSQGGNTVSGSSGSTEKISEATTAKPEVSTSVVQVPDNTKETTTKKEQGGQVVGTTSVVTETTTIISEENVAPGTEEEEYSYSDADEEKEKTVSASSVETSEVISGVVGGTLALASGSMAFVKSYNRKRKK